MKRYYFFIFFLNIYYSALAKPNEIPKFFKKSAVKGWEGDQSVTFIFTDRMGFMWIGTQDGLTKWDGRTTVFFNTNRESRYKLTGNHILGIDKNPVDSNAIWVLTSGGINQISIKKNEVISSFYSGEKYSLEFLQSSLTMKPVGKDLWLGSDDGLFIFNPTQKILIRLLTRNKSVLLNRFDHFIDIFHLNENEMWIFSEKHGIVVFDIVSKEILYRFSLDSFHFKKNNYIKRFSSIRFINKNQIRLVTNEKITTLTINRNKSLIIESTEKIISLNLGQIKNSIWESDEEVLIASDSGLFKYSPNYPTMERWVDMNSENLVNWTKEVQFIKSFEDNTFWLGTTHGLYSYQKKSQIGRNYFASSKKDAVLNRVFHIFPANQFLTYISDNSGFYRLNNHLGYLDLVLNDGPYFYSDSINKNVLIVSNINGSFLWKNSRKIRISSMYQELAALEQEVINSIIHSPNDTWVIATDLGNGFFIWNRKKRNLEKFKMDKNGVGLLNPVINGMRLLKDGTILILCEYEFAIFDPKNNILKNYEIKLPSGEGRLGIFMDIVELDSEFFFATYGNGIVKVDKNFRNLKFEVLDSSLNNFSAYKIFLSPSKEIFVTTNNGLYKLNISGSEIKRFHKRNGLQVDRYEEGAGIFKYGKLYIGGIRGISIVNPTSFPDREKTPDLNIHSVTLIDEKGEILSEKLNENSITILPKFKQFEINYNIIDFFPEEDDEFEYKILPSSIKWQNSKIFNKMTFIGLTPGNYTLLCRVKKKNSDWSNPIKIQLKIRPPWYQTLWFKALLVLATAALSYALYRYRLFQIRKEYRFKEKIAADLHDDLGSTLTGVKLYTELGVSSGSAEYYGPVKQGLVDATLALREMIWVLDNKTNTATNLLTKLEKNVQPLLHAGGMVLNLETEGSLEEIHFKTEEKRDMYLLLKEFINNSVKYSGCSHITLLAANKDRRIKLEISDNGKGFDPELIHSGNGLSNIEQRAKRCRYTVTWETGEGKGTKLVLVPA